MDSREFPVVLGIQACRRSSREDSPKWGIEVQLYIFHLELELELELIQTQMAQKPMLRAEVGMRVRCANKASAE